MRSILVLDQHSDSSRAKVFDPGGRLVASARRPLATRHPEPGRVEQDAMEIAEGQLAAAVDAVAQATRAGLEIAAIGITSRRDAVVFWDRPSGVPVCPALVDEDARGLPQCVGLHELNEDWPVHSRTGLRLDPRLAAARIAWVLDRDPVLRRRAMAGKLALGAIDGWLVWTLTAGAEHVIDVSHASRTALYDIDRHAWDDRLPEVFGVPREGLPRVVPSAQLDLRIAPGDADLAAVAPPLRALLVELLAALPPGVPISGIAHHHAA